jgi:hypothetical protein
VALWEDTLVVGEPGDLIDTRDLALVFRLNSAVVRLAYHLGILPKVDDRHDDGWFTRSSRQVEHTVWKAPKQGPPNRRINKREQ